MNLTLDGRAALITGGSKGLGLAMARSFAGSGGHVAIVARGAESLARAEAEIRAAAPEAKVVAIAADIATAEGCERAFAEAERALGQVDILVNNAGGGTRARLMSSDSDWAAAIDWMFWPGLRLSRLVAPAMRTRRSGVIVFIASIYGRELGGSSSYQVVKTAQLSLSKGMAKELASDNVRVLTVAPGSVSFPGGSWARRQQEDPEGIARFIAQDMPLGRFGRPEEVGDVIAFLCSDRASLVTGACIPVDGCQGRSLI
jgi:3-oxoacyl-[acyl-carrier protein] reductase